jgi:hypothetical protein
VANNPTLGIKSSLTIGEGAVFEMSRAANARPYGLVSYLNANGSIVFNNPKRVIMKNPSKHIFSAETGPINISGTVGAINIWTGGSNADSIDNAPTYMWNKQDGSPLSFNAVTASGKASLTTASASLGNFDAAVDYGMGTFDKNSFAIDNMQMLTMGSYSLSVDPVYENNTTASGTTDGGANVRLSWLGSGGLTEILNTASDDSGTWSALLPNNSLTADTEITALGYTNYLNFAKRESVLPKPGELSFMDVPSELAFENLTLPSTDTLVRRDNDDWTIWISETRSTHLPWNLTASIDAPLTAQSGADSYELPNALVFVNAQGRATPLSSSALLICSATTDSTKQTAVNWAANKGLLLKIHPGEARAGLEYQTTIHWSLEDAP